MDVETDRGDLRRKILVLDDIIERETFQIEIEEKISLINEVGFELATEVLMIIKRK